MILANCICPKCNARRAEENAARAFWQSRMNASGRRAGPPQLTDINALAKEIRHASSSTAR